MPPNLPQYAVLWPDSGTSPSVTIDDEPPSPLLTVPPPQPTGGPAGLTAQQIQDIIATQSPSFNGGQLFNSVIAGGPGAQPTPSRERAFFLTLSENAVNTYNSRKEVHGLLESAILQAEQLCPKKEETIYVFKCVGKIEFKKPTFDEVQDPDDAI